VKSSTYLFASAGVATDPTEKTTHSEALFDMISRTQCLSNFYPHQFCAEYLLLNVLSERASAVAKNSAPIIPFLSSPCRQVSKQGGRRLN
jgi:hypothetical protein